MFDVLPHSVGALQRGLTQIQESTVQLKAQLDTANAAQGEQLAQIRANLPAPKPAYEDPVPFIEAMAEPDVLRIAVALTFVRPVGIRRQWADKSQCFSDSKGLRLSHSPDKRDGGVPGRF